MLKKIKMKLCRHKFVQEDSNQCENIDFKTQSHNYIYSVEIHKCKKCGLVKMKKRIDTKNYAILKSY